MSWPVALEGCLTVVPHCGNMGPSLGALNRAALIAAHHVVIPLGADLYSVQGLKNLGPTLRRWREQWEERLKRVPESLARTTPLPQGAMTPVGYVVLQHAVRQDRPVKAYQRWLDRVPSVYSQWVLAEAAEPHPPAEDDPHCLATLKHYRSLMPLAQAVRKPMFSLTPADGAIGGHLQAARACHRDFSTLAETLAGRCGLSWH